MTVLDDLRAQRVLPILRAPTADGFPDVVAELGEAGLPCVELTITSAGALDALAALRGRTAGMGSVTTPQQAEAALAAGAAFLVTPAAAPGVLERVAGRVPVIAGALTPSEIVAAHAAGAAMVKVFPVSAVGGPPYIGAVRGPLPDIELVATGGVTPAEVGAYLAAGCAAVGLGGALGDLVARAREAVA